MKSTLFAISFLFALPFAAAHGYLRQISIDGTLYKGNIPQTTNDDSAIRLIDSVDPVKGATNRAVNCGQNAKIATLLANANPGSNITFDWAGGDNGNWPHNTGPLMTYLSTCGNTTCDQFDAINAQWFKIDEAGKKDDGNWVQQDIMNGQNYTVALPSNLTSGDYLVRHEIIALHLATEEGGAEFYPSCSQIRVGGNETGTPSSSDLVSLPGAYSDNDPGIFDPTVFDDDSNYVFPGPNIATLVDGGSSSNDHCGAGGSSSSSAASPSSSTPPAVSTITSFAITSTIALDAKVFPTALSNDDLFLRPRRFSRVMRGVYGRL
ncbi:glycosyl hydrolase family 61-domain-containing protein [Phellopilus nigrolimitatus]|nr:glycosyl hydrolase family 61-domain-containing protein [Phellopilus nigrolimitatus]